MAVRIATRLKASVSTTAGPSTVSDLRWEVGSDFHWDSEAFLDESVAGRAWLPPLHELYATGKGAMMAALISIENVGRLHVPSFFCMETVDVLSRYAPIGWYRELPDGEGPDFNTLCVVPGDAVLAVNLFGRSDGYQWDVWHREHPGIVLIEDHTHDPLSDWSQSSTADYAVASLRKTLPVPLGALLWSPSGLAVPAPRDDDACEAALLKRWR